VEYVATVLNGNVLIENSIFSALDLSEKKDNMRKAIIVTTLNDNNEIIVNNSTFTELETFNSPLFYTNNSHLTINHSNFKLCVVANNYLIYALNNLLKKITINNSTFQSSTTIIGGSENNISIMNSIIMMPKICNSPSLILDSTYSVINVFNTTLQYIQ